MKRRLLFALTSTVLSLFCSPRAPAAVAMIGNVVTYQNSDDSNPFLIVGNSQGGAILSVNDASSLTTVPSPLSTWGNPLPFLLYIGGIPIAGGTGTSGNSVTVTGTNSYLECLVLGIGAMGGSSNSVSVSGGAVINAGTSGGGVQDYVGSSFNSILVTDPGSLLQCTTIGLGGHDDSLRVENGAHLLVTLGWITALGSNSVILITGTNSLVNGGINLSGDESSLTINNSAQVYGYGIYINGTNDAVSIDGMGTYVNAGIEISQSNDHLAISGGAHVDAHGPAADYYDFELGFSGETNVMATVADPGTALNIFQGVFDVGANCSGCSLMVSNGAVVAASCDIFLGPEFGAGDTVLVTGAGSQLAAPTNTVYIGGSSGSGGSAYGLGSGNQLIVGSGGFVSANNVMIQMGNSGNVAGNLSITNSNGSGQLTVAGAFNITGIVQADAAVLDYTYLFTDFFGNQHYQTIYGAMPFSTGKFMTKGLSGTDPGTPFVIGDGTNMANYVMLGGTHSFNGGLIISSNSVLSGCGTVTGSVTNYGLIILTNGCDMDFSNSVVNFGTIVATNGTPQFHSTFQNNGFLITNGTGSSAVAQNLLLNGSFESPSLPSNSYNGGATPAAWQASSSDVGMVNGLSSYPYGVWPLPAEGQQYVDLGNRGVGDAISQIFTVTNSGVYILSWFGSAPNYSDGVTSSPYLVTVSNNDTAQIVVTTNFDDYHDTPAWGAHSIPLALNSDSYTLTFQTEAVPGLMNSELDDVSLTRQTNSLAIITQPQSQVGYWGKSISFSVAATNGTPPYNYQWQKESTPIVGATNALLAFTNLQFTNAGAYQAVIFDSAYYFVTSNPAILTVNSASVDIAIYPGVRIDGVVGLTYGIQFTTNLADPNSWLGLTNLTFSAATEIWYDSVPASLPQRFYRVLPGPISIP